ncbi:META domain-containing protein [Pedobacter montanisoli]|uniref:META domain-containing protein n=1 Tax=Pedobacter montanisoli TaxID=2923277 RepID=A0ABS9ZWK8_9SPHI|nr:META domain-containing protein [Pedobacter montanisoli]MCJ0742705.1 META domain-containing protein [Pedobacter montanisoli]
MKKSFLIIALAVVAAACNNTNTNSKTTTDTLATQTKAVVTADLFGTQWKLNELNGKAIKLDTAFKKEPHLVFEKETNKFNGNAGCNNFMGSFKLKDSNGIELSQVGATMMACPNLAVETEFLDAMKKVKTYHIEGNVLMLNDEKNTTLAKLSTQ